MPLHLLGKKSWNVYNPANIERVRRDEAEAKKQEEKAERKARQDEADDRLAILRGDKQGGPTERDIVEGSVDHRRSKKRKLIGEDDTDRDIRLAQQSQAQSNTSLQSTLHRGQGDRAISLTDKKGNFSLIPQSQSQVQSQPRSRVDDNPTHFYLSSAATGQTSTGLHQPWYKIPKGEDQTQWGSTSPRRQEREAERLSTNDPLALMKRGVKKLRESERERQQWREQRERDLREVEDMARRERRRKERQDHHHNRDHDRKQHGRHHEDGESHGRHPRHHRRHHQAVEQTGSRKSAPSDVEDLDSLEDFDLDKGHSRVDLPPDHDRHRRRRDKSDRERRDDQVQMPGESHPRWASRHSYEKVHKTQSH
ncbi:hypothetical protein PV10_02585 [Exophiala mesophila]|uniref:CBF1-interacting co-repressor CIR N-terminal domain-containing protein n=1 Tax=Exophiala mesophila TaxID=212818 RepID=A0A0D1Y2P2_EXOME|nr:uncharacterized protein PV10_02585 [Exophiala mesophila]KIV94861.1 hypothetical protein PV10_02585 [Exophiala mesophila]